VIAQANIQDGFGPERVGIREHYVGVKSIPQRVDRGRYSTWIQLPGSRQVVAERQNILVAEMLVESPNPLFGVKESATGYR